MPWSPAVTLRSFRGSDEGFVRAGPVAGADSSMGHVLWPWPGNGEHHMAFSMVAQPLPVTTINTPRLEGSGHRFGSQEDQGSVDHTPKLPFVALQSSSAGRVGRPVAASKFASSSISRLWRRSISAPSLVLRPYDIPNYKCGTWTKPHSIHIKFLWDQSDLRSSRTAVKREKALTLLALALI
ncbi:hypothetical protein L207DRAFT_531652 [Hyaloscypha variabilis F]|uniref:Uncharacterized protein n=1 Tax=Hyaloscypha variabilis (strain UAMH 11265 / GT02V1 / F) TaxID=1149755 RepID=A0A2J6RFR0_HYAVF|nr:hypothetical protein L207DRAFT_531652 [Hyaloscypha variabilis F]